MAIPFIKPSCASGEAAPAFYGRIDVNKWHSALSVARNLVVSYLGGVFSRAGTALVGMSKQLASSTSIPPRIIEFRFSIYQSYILEFGDRYMRVIAAGAYVTESAFNVTGATQANPCVVRAPGHNFVIGDWVYPLNIGGMTQLDARLFIVAGVNGNLVTLSDTFGDPVNSLAYGAFTNGGTIARVYTLVTPYAAADLPYLKFTQSADVMSLVCVNQATFTDYPPQELTRLAAANWTIAPPSFGASITAPTSCTVTGTAYASGPGPAAYGYVVTAIDAVTGQESIASNIGAVTSVVDIAGQFGTNVVSWTAPVGATVSQYNIYRATPDYKNVGAFTGQLFGYVGSTSGAVTWQDTNIIADFTTTPPLHTNPFPSTGNYPGTVAYFQQRRGYAYTINAPDTYKFSKTGAYLNFDSGQIPIDSDSFTGTPWAVQVNGIQHMTPMPGGLIIQTGYDNWQLSGTAGVGSPVSPAQQNAQQQEANGCSPTLPPLKIDNDILFGQALGSAIRDMQYNFYFNMYSGADTTIISNHLFFNFQILQWTWAREPYKVVWMVRNDGKALSLSYIKDQEIKGYTRHDTNGLFVSVASASEPPVNAVYWVVKRYIPGKTQWAYFIERMDNRLWNGDIEKVWAVDCALSLPMTSPNATLSASAAQGSGGVLVGPVIAGGNGYTAAVQGTVIDQGGTGSGAVVSSITLVAGVITGITIAPEGKNYSAPLIQFTDVAGGGSGGIVAALVDQAVTFSADQPVFSAGDINAIIRSGGGAAMITAVANAQTVTANVFRPIVQTMPNDPNALPLPASPGTWTKTAPVTTVAGLDHLEGMQVTGLADGHVIPVQPVTNGAIVLPAPSSAVTVGLPFVAQGQTLDADVPGAVILGKHKKAPSVTLRVNQSRGIQVGQDQPIAATQPYQAEIPWGVTPYGQLAGPNEQQYGLTQANAINAGTALPLFTGDIRIPITTSDWNTPTGERAQARVGFQQSFPLPMEILAVVPDLVVGDSNG